MQFAKFPVLRCTAILVLAALGCFVTPPSFAQNPHAKIFGDWRVRCNSAIGAPSNCHMFQNAIVQQTKQPILQAIVGYINDVPNPIGEITLPLGVYLLPGLTMQIDDGQIYEMGFEFCSSGGCRVRFSIDEKLLGSFKGGNKAEIAFFNPARKRVRVPISLKGFTAAIGQLR